MSLLRCSRRRTVEELTRSVAEALTDRAEVCECRGSLSCWAAESLIEGERLRLLRPWVFQQARRSKRVRVVCSGCGRFFGYLGPATVERLREEGHAF